MSSYKELDKKDRLDFYIALAVILSVLSFVLYYSLSHLFTDKEVAFLQSDIEETHLDDTLYIDGDTYVPLIVNQDIERNISSVNEVEELEVIIDSNAISSTLIEHKGNSSLDVSNAKSETKNLILDDLPVKVDTTTTERVDLKPENDQEASSIKENITGIIDSATIEKSVVQVVTPKKSKEIDKSCIIAVGIYRNKRNAEKMLNRLEKAGFNAFSTKKRNKYRVQVYHSCDTDALNNTLRDIRTNYASDALILIKE